ncbi:aminoglycoside phosphotransferase family protein [Pseudoxanthomonas suwonensis]|uniref:Aminoglycoside phosphotransferase n=1 Tax=Pseudoxanthomonas suwonensis TaxID=314722 RepID=A0A0E3Z3P3_9GAMM|nr:phosphotransferase [Pseudoxanthomonas suwonensis]AKC87627.1 aminoglycoside phosphotransferase [Pseudoxanthomonas suwonensis]
MPATDRADQRLAWTRQALSDPALALQVASADASFRSYWRTASGGHSWIVMDAPPGREDIRPWLEIGARLAAAGLHTPAVRASDADLGFVLMEDLGDRLYLPALRDGDADALYTPAIDAILAMQARVPADGLPAFDEPWMVMELELMPEWFLRRHLGLEPECEDWDPIESAFRAILNAAHAQPQRFMHRDFHSRNLLVADDPPGVIDFQGAMRGPLAYDLASLLRDCYIAWPDARVAAWREHYRRRAVALGLTDAGEAEFARWFDLTGLQRHIKVLGIFCRLAYRDGKPGYLADLPLVWRYVREVGNRHEEIRPMVALLERAIGGGDLTRLREA